MTAARRAAMARTVAGSPSDAVDLHEVIERFSGSPFRG
jgi:hypothetical protein